MNSPAASVPSGTPREIASSITKAWLLYFLVHTAVLIVINLALGSVYRILMSSFASNPIMMQVGYTLISLVINAPISYVLFQWAVRGNVVPAILSWAQQPEGTPQ